MRRFFCFSIIAISLLLSCSKSEQKDNESQKLIDTTATFSFSNGMCEYIGVYNPQEYSEEQLKNTYELCLWTPFVGFGTLATKPSQILEMDSNKLIHDYKLRRENIEKANIINSEYWNNVKVQRLTELENEFLLNKTSMQAFSDASVLKENKFLNECPEIVEALTSNDTSILLSFWKEFVIERSLHNAKEDYMDEFNEKYNSAEKMDYAKIDLITYGWFNCINHTIDNLNNSKLEIEFRKLFLNLKTECEDVD